MVSQVSSKPPRLATAAETQWSSATHLEIIVTGKRLRVTAVNTTGTLSPTDTSVSKEPDLY